MLSLAKVVAVHPEDHSFEILFLDTGARAVGVPSISGAGASSRTGTVDFPVPNIDPNNKWAPPDQTDTQITAVVGWMGKQPIIVGFLYPQVSEMLFADSERRISRHTSDVYTSIDAQGNAEFYHPSGAYIRFGTNPAHEDLTGKDLDGHWQIRRNTGQAVHIHVQQAGNTASIDIAPDGTMVVDSNTTLTANVAQSATVNCPVVTVNASTSVTLNTPNTHLTGNLQVDGNATVSGSHTVNGSTSVKGITSNGVNIGSSHVHGGVNSGSSNTQVPH